MRFKKFKNLRKYVGWEGEGLVVREDKSLPEYITIIPEMIVALKVGFDKVDNLDYYYTVVECVGARSYNVDHTLKEVEEMLK